MLTLDQKLAYAALEEDLNSDEKAIYRQMEILDEQLESSQSGYRPHLFTTLFGGVVGTLAAYLVSGDAQTMILGGATGAVLGYGTGATIESFIDIAQEKPAKQRSQTLESKPEYHSLVGKLNEYVAQQLIAEEHYITPQQ